MNAADIKTNLEQDYYVGQTPEQSCGKDIIPRSRVAGAEFEYAECKIDGALRLVIICPGTIGGNGPGRKLTAT